MSTEQPARAALSARIDLIEEAYEYMLAYAAQGFATDADSRGPSIRDYLTRLARATGELQELARALLGAAHADFTEVLAHDASAAAAALQLVRSGPAISSQLVDNLNGSVHLRALLTDLFVLDEYLKIPDGPVDD